MACLVTAGRKEPCKDAIGGITKVFFADFGSLTITDAADKIQDIGNVTVFEYELKGTNNLEENITTSRENGTTFYEQILSLVLKKQDSDSTKEIAILAVARPHIFVQFRNGDLVLVGEEEGADLTGGSLVSGTAQGDLNGYNLTFTGMEILYARYLVDSTLADPFGGMTPGTVTVVPGTNS